METIQEQEIKSLVKKYDEVKIVVSSQEDKERAIKIVQEIAKATKQVKDWFAPIKKKAHEAWKEICNREKEILDKLQERRDAIQKEIISFEEAETRRLEQERARLQAEAEARAKAEREALLKKAEQAKREETKMAYLAQAEAVITPVVSVAEPPKVKGASFREVWYARVVDVNLLPREYMKPDEQLLNSIARAKKGQIQIPGVEFYCEKTLVVNSTNTNKE